MPRGAGTCKDKRESLGPKSMSQDNTEPIGIAWTEDFATFTGDFGSMMGKDCVARNE